MKYFLGLFLIFISTSVIAYNHAYPVSGILENGEPVDGIAYERLYYSTLNGQLTDSNGYIHSFEGCWIGYGKIRGETDLGDSVVLYTMRNDCFY